MTFTKGRTLLALEDGRWLSVRAFVSPDGETAVLRTMVVYTIGKLPDGSDGVVKDVEVKTLIDGRPADWSISGLAEMPEVGKR